MEKLLKAQLLQIVRDYNIEVLIPNYHKKTKAVLVNEMNKHLVLDESTNKISRIKHNSIDIKNIEKKKKAVKKEEVVAKTRPVSEETKKRVAELHRKRKLEEIIPKLSKEEITKQRLENRQKKNELKKGKKKAVDKMDKIEEIEEVTKEKKPIGEYEKEIEDSGTLNNLITVFRKMPSSIKDRLQDIFYKKYSEIRKAVLKGLTDIENKKTKKIRGLRLDIQILETEIVNQNNMDKKKKLQEEIKKITKEIILLNDEEDKYQDVEDKLKETKMDMDEIIATHEYIHNLYENEHDEIFKGMGMIQAHLINLSLPKLYAICKKYNLHNRIKNYTKLKKGELINKMKGHLIIENNKVVINPQLEKLTLRKK